MIDFTFVSCGLAKGNNCWEVSEIYTQSEHRSITWRVRRQQRPKNRQSQSRKKFNGWKASAFDAGAMRARIKGSCAEGLTAEDKVEDVMQKVANACDAAMSRKGNPHTPIHWWSDKIAQLIAECHKTRRLSQRAKGKPTFPELEETFKLARSKLTKAIKHRKRRCLTKLLEVIDEDPWGNPYKVVVDADFELYF